MFESAKKRQRMRNLNAFKWLLFLIFLRREKIRVHFISTVLLLFWFHRPSRLFSFPIGGRASCILWECFRREPEKQNSKVNFILKLWNIHVTFCTRWLQGCYLGFLPWNTPGFYRVYSIYHTPLTGWTAYHIEEELWRIKAQYCGLIPLPQLCLLLHLSWFTFSTLTT